MSSNESNSNSVPQPAAPDGKPRSSAGLVALSLILLAGLVWAMAPARAKFEPAPLRTVPSGCSQTTLDFVPSDATEVPGVDLSSLSKGQRNHVLFRLNMEPCPCGCNTSIAACRISHPTCPICKDLVEKIVAEESGARGQEPEVRSQK
ncbi:MAG TPA: hypothetical protein VKO18_18525 [Terriglobia bacterium]|nr:hypothetical protein [Terriglobia bacterium]